MSLVRRPMDSWISRKIAMRESDHDCVQPQDDFTFVIPDVESSNTPPTAKDDALTTGVMKKNPGSGLDGLGGGRLDGHSTD